MLNERGKELMKPWVSVQNAVLLFAVIFVLALLKLTSSELASWVQAVGSIAAIAAAVWVSSSQRREQIKFEKLRIALQIESIRTLSARARRVVQFDSHAELNLDSSSSQITGLRISFESINILDLPAASLVEPISTMKDALRALEAGMIEAQRQQILNRYVTYKECALWVALVMCADNDITKILENQEAET